MSWLVWTLVIFLTSLLVILAAGILTSRDDRPSLDRLADPLPLPGEPVILPRPGWLTVHDPSAGGASQTGQPYSMDTGPLLFLSEQAAANVALEREIRQRCAEAEAKIPPRWRS